MSDHKLVLHPRDPDAVPRAPLLGALRDLGLVGHAVIRFGETRYGLGPRFFELVSAWWDDDGFIWECSGCGARTSPPRLDWGRGGGFARVCIDVWHVHAGEAEPTEALLSALAATTCGAWTFHYYRL